ncbi:acetyl-CoA synthetase-like protein [Cristinia sonorae]|uniref:Acetyl-CoA synthetase-like protein n=1 Tax=Cristinia sonorae TaxID=1940300 RepID=A0A8K0UNH4_9AGAR|nr:acetyl-CoA synthetase-like protein [Cristinia sonorae]
MSFLKSLPPPFVQRPVTGIPKNQGLSSKTFRVPPLDGSLTIPEIWDWHLEYSPEHPLFVFNDEKGQEVVIRFREAVHAMHRAGRLVRSRLPDDVADSRPVIAILAASDTITFFLVEAGIMRANCIFFPISPRNSASAVAHLLTKTDAQHLIVGPEPSLQKLASEALRQMEDVSGMAPPTSVMPQYKDVMKEIPEGDFELLPPFRFRLEDVASIFHSSGSSAFPKPIASWHYRTLMNGTVPNFGVQDLTGIRTGFQAIPMFHGWGGMLISWAATCGPVLYTFEPKSPAILPTPDNTLRAMTASRCQIAFSVPSFLEAWSKRPEDVMALKQITKGIFFGGGPLDEAVGDYLVGQGVTLICGYGSTECGLMHQVISENMGKDWQYMNFDVPSVRLHWDHKLDGTAELVMLTSPYVLPAMFNTSVKGEPAFATNDLFVRHPTKPGLWKVYGRADDQIMHSTGEKTNPGPLEAILNQDPSVERCLMFGRGHFNAGVLVEPIPALKFEPSDLEKLAAFRNLIWPTVERMNEYAPQHSRIFKEMILVTTPRKPFHYTAKNTPRRQAIVKDYEREIEALYAAAEETTQANQISPPDRWDFTSTTSFVRLVVSRVVAFSFDDTDDLFQKGCDSLQATWIRNSLLHALRENGSVNTKGIPSTFVYQYPTVVGLAQYITSLGSPSSQEYTNGAANASQVVVDAMLAMVEKYRINLPKHVPSTPAPSKDIVLVTGTTGSLGCIILSNLLHTPEVGHVFALNRGNEEGRSLLERQRERLVEWGMDPEVTQSPKVTFVEADMTMDKLGLSPDLYEKIRSSVTHIVHNGYRVNFNLALASFEPNVRTARHLVDLALSSPHLSPPRLLFVSSIGVLSRHTGDGAVKEEPVDPSCAVSSGYSESKWVVERLLSVAQEETPLRPVTVRVGQVAGGPNGAWNSNEWFPTMLKSSVYLGCLPLLSGHVSWIPSAAVAQSIIEMRNSPHPVLHLVHPRPVSWADIITPVSQALSLPLVSYADWLARLRESGANLHAEHEVEIMKVNPALRILDFFSGVDLDSSSGEAMGIREMDMTKAREVANVLSGLPPLSKRDVLGWLSYWGLV